jgi:hypothetical protein
MSFQDMKRVKWRRIGLFLTLAMLIGPGLIINVVLKDNWGRPRPRHTIEFGGKYAFEQVLSYDSSSPGYSFPCGHASMGFYLFIPWFVLRKKHKALAALSLSTGIVYGTLIGVVRMAQGGHYASDVIISGILTYLTGAAIFYAFRLNKAIWYHPKSVKIDNKQRAMVAVVMSFLFIIMLLGVILATPYNKIKAFSSKQDTDTGYAVTKITINLDNADIRITPADSLSFSTDTQGFGFPGSKLTGRFREEIAKDTLQTSFTQKRKGFFTELVNNVNGTINYKKPGILNLKQKEGEVAIVLSDSLKQFELNIDLKEGTLDVDLPAGFKPKITMKGDFELSDQTGFNSSDSIYVNPDFKVNLIVRKGKLILH